MKLSVSELENINGGNVTTWYILAGVGVFLAGLFVGFFNGKSCK